MNTVHLALPEEIALEGLDGITLDALWFRLSERLKLSLPLSQKFQNEIWKLILSRTCFEFFEIENDRPTPKRMDRREFFNNEISTEEITEYMNAVYFIYTYNPVDDPFIRGSCLEFKTRKKLDHARISKMSLEQVEESFQKKFVIVASQNLRNSILIPKNIGRECDINNHAYCILERIGRARHFGEVTSGSFSINEFVKDSKLLHYFRSSLMENNLVVRQQFQSKIRGKVTAGQLFHLPRFYVLLGTSNMLMTEQLIGFLKAQPNHIVESDAARKHIGCTNKTFLNIIKSRPNLFKSNFKTLYREIYPNANESEYLYKVKSKGEKTISTVKLIDPNYDVMNLWRTDDDEDGHGADKGFIDISRQQINCPLVHQVCQKIAEAGKEGMSQLEVGNYFGLTRLNSRAVLRKLQRHKNLSHFMKDEGRQRVAKYVSQDVAMDASVGFVAEVEKLQLKAEESSVPSPIQIVYSEKTSKWSPTKISIAMSPAALKCYKPEPQGQSAIKFVSSSQNEENAEDHNFIEPEPVEHFKVEDQLTQIIIPDEDSSFIDNVEDVVVSMRFLNSIPNIQKPAKGIAQAVAQNKLSHKVLTRMNTILDILKGRTVIDSVTLLQLMREKEADLKEMICRKSMLTLCGKLAIDNFLKVVEMELKSENKTVLLIFFGDPSLSFNMKCWHSIIEEQKIVHFLSLHGSCAESNTEGLLRPSMSNISIETKTSTASEEFGPQSKRYQNFPKFMKMKLFHEFLFYLIYGFPEDHKKIPIETAVESWIRETPKVVEYEQITEKITSCYSTEISWKMFVSPLNQQANFEGGWALMRDIIHRLPLILFVKFTRAAQGSPLLEQFLNHPIKCNYLLHFLPMKLRAELLQGRKYIFVIQDLCKKLCWCGLLQFGPSRTKELDQTYLYLNQNATLLDTTTSDEGYMEVSEKEYAEINYTFDSPKKITDYWNQMYQIALNTKINKRSAAVGSTEIEQISSKPGLQIALKTQTAKSAPINDTGMIPGDHKGAAGLDRAFLVHLKRSWTRPMEHEKKIRSRAVSAPSKAKAKSRREKASVTRTAAAKIKSKTISSVQSKFKPKTGIVGISGNSKMIRKSLIIKQVKQRALLAQDLVDKQALKMMKTMRVTWSEVEDRTLILAKVAMKFAFNQETQSAHYINSSVIRDILHWRTNLALNKTSKACGRRIQYLMKTKPSVNETIALYVEELKTKSDLVMKYKNLADRLKKIYPLEQVYSAIKIHFVQLVHKLHQIFYKQFLGTDIDAAAGSSTKLDLPKDYDTLVSKFKIINPSDSLTTQNYREPKTSNEAEVSMLMSLIHSAVCCNHDKSSYSYQLFEVYKKFSDTNLSLAVTQLKRATVISVNKKEKSKDNSILPYSFSPFHLSTRYSAQIMSIHITVDLYDEYLKAIKTLSDCNGSYQLSTMNCGWLFMLGEMMGKGKIHLTNDEVGKLVMVDPALRAKSNFDQISDNYNLLMNKNQDEKKTVKIQSDENHNETFLFSEDPIEIFFRINQLYLHAFCILRSLGDSGDLESKSWTCLSTEGTCFAEDCVLVNDDNFAQVILKIACRERETVRGMLSDIELSEAKPVSDVITKQNFVTFFDDVIEKHLKGFESDTRKDFCGKTMNKWKKLTAMELVKAIFHLSTAPGLDEDCWLSEYKKISQKSDEVHMEDEDMDPVVDHIKTSKIMHQLKDLNVNSRTSDSFVVNLSTIYVDITDCDGTKETFEGNEIDPKLMPFNDQDKAKCIEKILAQVKFTPKDLEDKILPNELAAAGVESTLEIIKISEICSFIKSKGPMGATPMELLETCSDKNRLQRYIELLMEVKFVQRVGVIEMRFIHKSCVGYWFIDTFYSKRDGNNSEKIPDENSNKRTNDEPCEGEPSSKKAKEDELKNVASLKKSIEEPQPSTSAECLKNDKAQITPSESSTSMDPPKKTPLIRYPIRLRPSPWIRVNGTLNRRVLDKWLGTFLNHLTINPSMMLTDLNQKFNVLTPFDSRSICEILEMIGSVRLMSISEPEVDIFSSFTDSIVEPATFFDPSDRVFVDLNDDAVQRLALFIGRKKYKTPFI